jgi:hypothetical protein
MTWNLRSQSRGAGRRLRYRAQNAPWSDVWTSVIPLQTLGFRRGRAVHASTLHLTLDK